MPTVHAVRLLATPDGVFDRLLVRACVFCHLAHLHYVPAGSADERVIRAPRCATWRRYAIEVTDVLPVMLVAGQRRKAS